MRGKTSLSDRHLEEKKFQNKSFNSSEMQKNEETTEQGDSDSQQTG